MEQIATWENPDNQGKNWPYAGPWKMEISKTTPNSPTDESNSTWSPRVSNELKENESCPDEIFNLKTSIEIKRKKSCQASNNFCKGHNWRLTITL